MPNQLPNSVQHELIAAEGRTGLTAALSSARAQLPKLFAMTPADVEEWFKQLLDSNPAI